VKILGCWAKVNGYLLKIKGVGRSIAAQTGHIAEKIVGNGFAVGRIKNLGYAAPAEMDNSNFGNEGGKSGGNSRIYRIPTQF
jgi:hypothetical protein